jgi:hypothetical protein
MKGMKNAGNVKRPNPMKKNYGKVKMAGGSAEGVSKGASSKKSMD